MGIRMVERKADQTYRGRLERFAWQPCIGLLDKGHDDYPPVAELNLFPPLDGFWQATVGCAQGAAGEQGQDYRHECDQPVYRQLAGCWQRAFHWEGSIAGVLGFSILCRRGVTFAKSRPLH